MQSPAVPSLSLRALFKTAGRKAGMQDAAPVFTGLSAPGKALAVAMNAGEGPSVLVVASDRDIEGAVADLRFFMCALEGASAADVVAGVLPFPSPEVDPYRGLAPHFDVASARARARCALAEGTARGGEASAPAHQPR
ncbi:MAG: hypothetical protein AB7I50_10625, partial [Vicinamibacterales bacterium]